ncbi:MAG: PAS domain-containing protein [Pseudomonadota bacterium]
MAGIEDKPGATRGNGHVHDMMGERMTRTSPLLEETWRYWSSLREGTNLPRRDALEPRAMAFTLGHSMILDRIRPGTVRVRLGGRVMQTVMGMEVRGLPVRAFFDLAERTLAVHLIEEVFETRAALDLDLISDGEDGPLSGKLLVLPLLDHGGQPTKALTCLSLDGPVFDPPRRFRILDHRLTPIQAPAPALLPRPVETRPAMELAEPPAAYRASPVPWLRVVK